MYTGMRSHWPCAAHEEHVAAVSMHAPVVAGAVGMAVVGGVWYVVAGAVGLGEVGTLTAGVWISADIGGVCWKYHGVLRAGAVGWVVVGAVGWMEVGASTVEVTVYPATEEAMHAKAKTDARRAWLLTLCKCRTCRRSLKLVEVPALTKSAILFSTMRLKLCGPYLEVYPQKEILVNEKSGGLEHPL